MRQLRPNTSKVYEYMKQHPGVDFHVQEIARNTEIAARQLHTCLATLARRDKRLINTHWGRWMYKGPMPRPASPAVTPPGQFPTEAELFECIGRTPDGAFLLKSTSGQFLKAVTIL